MIKKEKLMLVGVEKLADILLRLYEDHKDMRKIIDIMVAGLAEDPKKMTLILRKEILSLRRSTKFIDYDESRTFANRLNQLRHQIAEDLIQKSPAHGFDLMMEFLDLHEGILNRVDDSNGMIGDAFKEACRDLEKITDLPRPVEEIVDLVFTRFMDNGFGIYDELIQHSKASLKEEGLYLLQKQFQKSLNEKNTMEIKHGLQAIADCQKDVEAYIRACSLSGKPSNYDHLNIAKRLIDHWRGEEALHWLETMEPSSHNRWPESRRELKIEALELKGEYEKAQVERLRWFEESLSPALYGEILKYAKPDFKEAFRKEAIAKAFTFAEPHEGLEFLIELQEFAEGAKFVRLKIDELHGRHYGLLRPVANILCEIDPLAATLLYRKMIEPVLEAAASKYYIYAAKDLVSCGTLNSKIKDWALHQNHESYMKSVEEKNNRKVSFWVEYKVAIQKQIARDSKK